MDEQGQKSWPVSHYQQEGERVSNWFAEGVIKQHRKLASWINALIAAGFVLEQLDEWGPTAEQIAAQPAPEEEKERPMIFLSSARAKPGANRPAPAAGRGGYSLRFQAGAAAGNHVLIPVKTLLLTARQGAGAVIMAIDIDKAVALRQLCLRGAHQVNQAPSW